MPHKLSNRITICTDSIVSDGFYFILFFCLSGWFHLPLITFMFLGQPIPCRDSEKVLCKKRRICYGSGIGIYTLIEY